jgi:hypothetical protein
MKADAGEIMISSPLNPDFRAEARYILTEIEQQREFIPAPGKCVIADGVHRLLDVVETFVRGMLGTAAPSERRPAETQDLPVNGLCLSATIGFDQEGRPAEVFLSGAKDGSTMAAILDDVSVIIPVAVQHGVPAAALANSVSRLPATALAPPYLRSSRKQRSCDQRHQRRSRHHHGLPHAERLKFGQLRCGRNPGENSCVYLHSAWPVHSGYERIRVENCLSTSPTIAMATGLQWRRKYLPLLQEFRAEAADTDPQQGHRSTREPHE